MKRQINKYLVLIILSFFLFPINVMGMQIFVQTSSSKNITLEVESSDTIETVKEKIASKENVKPEYLKIFFGNKELQDGRTLADYKIIKESTINVIFSRQIMIVVPENGEIKISNERAFAGEKIILDILPNNNYSLQNIHVFKSGDANVSIDVEQNAFIMPDYDVTIEAEFIENISNPSTSDTIIFNVCLMFFSLVGCLILFKSYNIKSQKNA